jgi:glycosyltransferase involved in cell wall biosynthesis
MRILHVVHQYFPDHVGGTEHYTRTLAQAQRQGGHQVAILCRRGGGGPRLDRTEMDGLPVYQAAKGPLTAAGRFRATLGDRFLAECFRRVLQKVEPDLIHIQHLMGLPAGALARLVPSAPLVVTLHDYWWRCANAQLITDYGGQVCDGPHWWLNCARCGLARIGLGSAWPLSPLAAPLFAWRAAALQRLVPQIAAWIAPTHFVSNWYVASGLPAERMHVVGHGIELPPAHIRKPADGPRDEGRQKGARRFAYIGGLSRQKGVHVLVDAFNGLPPEARLTIAGDETAFPDYCADLHRRATHPGIRFAGRLGRPAVWETLAEVDAVIVPSLWFETASLIVQESFAVGTPVIAADHGALVERVQHGVDGLRVPPGDAGALRDAMRRLMDDAELMARLERGIQPVVTIAQHVDEVEEIYRQVTAGTAIEGTPHVAT